MLTSWKETARFRCYAHLFIHQLYELSSSSIVRVNVIFIMFWIIGYAITVQLVFVVCRTSVGGWGSSMHCGRNSLARLRNFGIRKSLFTYIIYSQNLLALPCNFPFGYTCKVHVWTYVDNKKLLSMCILIVTREVCFTKVNDIFVLSCYRWRMQCYFVPPPRVCFEKTSMLVYINRRTAGLLWMVRILRRLTQGVSKSRIWI